MTRKRSLPSACALPRASLRRLSNIIGLWGVSRKWMKTGRLVRLRPELLPPLSGYARVRSRTASLCEISRVRDSGIRDQEKFQGAASELLRLFSGNPDLRI